jgi:hypothetical protein
MSLLAYAKMPFSFEQGWDKVCLLHPNVLKTFLLLVLPFSLIPPAMLIYAGGHHASAYLVDAPLARWQTVAELFLLAELLTVPLIGWAIRFVADVHKIRAAFRDTFLLAGVTAVPMWLFALFLAVPNMWWMIAGVVAGLLLSAGVLYHGATRILKISDAIEAQSLSAEVFAVGALVWACLCAIVISQLLG